MAQKRFRFFKRGKAFKKRMLFGADNGHGKSGTGRFAVTSQQGRNVYSPLLVY